MTLGNGPNAVPEAPYPAFLRLRGRKVVVVGAGPVAAAKYAGLRVAGADLFVIAPEVSQALRQHGTDGATLIEREFRPGDLDGAWYVVAAAPPEVNRQVAVAAEARQLFVNAVDDVGAATSYAGAIVRRGDVTIAISTGGEAPALAGLLREALEVVVPEDVADWATEARAQRPWWRTEGVPMADRRPRLLQAINDLYAARGSQP